MGLKFLAKLLHPNLINVFLAGIVMGLATAPLNAWWVAWVALIPLWIQVLGKQRDSIPIPLAGLGWGLGYHGLALSWITGIHPMTWMGVPWLASVAIAAFAWGFITLWGAVLVVLWAPLLSWLNQRFRLNAWGRVLVGTAIWSGLEALWHFGPLVWTALGYTQSPGNLVILHLGQVSGPMTVSAAIVAINGLLAEAWLQWKERTQKPLALLVVSLGLLVGLHGLGWSLYSQPLGDRPDLALKAGIIQGNVPNTIKLYPEGWRRAIEGYTTGYEKLADQGVDAVLTPETALPFTWQNLQQSTFLQAVRDRGIPVWLGAFGQHGASLTNSLLGIGSQGQLLGQYDKTKLVPLGEYIPFEEFLGQFIDRLSPLDAHLAAGTSDQVFQTPWGNAIASICYESAFGDHLRDQTARGGQFILSASNDAHYSAAMPAQHHAQDIMRAIESDRWMLRATNTGYSAIVDPHGHTLWQSTLNTYALHAETIYRRQTQTLYVRWGNWFTPVLVLVSLGLLGFKGLQIRRSPQT